MANQSPFQAFIMLHGTSDNFCASCTCGNRECHCEEPCLQCDCGDCQCKDMYKRTGWAEPTVGME